MASIEGPADILLVDDSPANLRLLSQILAERGYHVRAVTSGLRALASIRLNPPDLILLDIRMPGMDGYEVCAQLRASPRTEDIPILFISALDDIGDKVKAFSTGGVDYITKPFQLEEVVARVQTHLALRELRRDLQEANRRMEGELALAARVQASFPDRPELVCQAVNERLVEYSATDQFVTVFLGVLDLRSGALVYSNAGHNPPVILSPAREGPPQLLGNTGLPLGLLAETTWQPGRVTLAAGDVLVLYTDGITEAESAQQGPYGLDRLVGAAREVCARPACEIRDAILGSVQEFARGVPLADDMALMVLKRE